MSPDGSHLYAASSGTDAISTFTVSAQGDLSAVGTATPTGATPGALAITPDGKYLFATSSANGTVSGWSIAGDGSLTSLGDPVAAGSGASGIAVSSDGTRLVTANATAGTISSFVVGSNGSLTSAGPSTTGPTGARSVVISPDGENAIVGGSASIAAYALSQTGQLALRTGSPINTSSSQSALTFVPDLPPQARFEPTPAPAGKASSFDGGSSLDDDGLVTKWEWNFGDGSTGNGQAISHVYQHAGTYNVTLTATDNEGCSTTRIYTGQTVACFGDQSAVVTRQIVVPEAVPEITPDQVCQHNGNDGFCGTPDEIAPMVTILGFQNGASITTLDAPQEFVGTITPDPSGIKSIQLRFTKTSGTVVKRTTVTKRVCRNIRGKRKCARKAVYKRTCKKVKGKRRCTRKKVVKVTRAQACLSVSGTKTYLVKYQCSKVPWIAVAGDTTFRYELPVALGTGSYSVEVLATDGAGNTDVLEDGRNRMTFKVINTPSNSGGDTGGGTDTGATGGGGTSGAPVDDTGSPFGKG
jgi:PKD domain/Lactonase, 7-bladed beta-propeller